MFKVMMEGSVYSTHELKSDAEDMRGVIIKETGERIESLQSKIDAELELVMGLRVIENDD